MVLVGTILLAFRSFRNFIGTNDKLNKILTYVSFPFACAGFLIAIMEVSNIVNNININIQEAQQIEEKVREIEKKMADIPIKTDTVYITRIDTMRIIKIDTLRIPSNKLEDEVEQVDRDEGLFQRWLEEELKKQ